MYKGSSSRGNGKTLSLRYRPYTWSPFIVLGVSAGSPSFSECLDFFRHSGWLLYGWGISAFMILCWMSIGRMRWQSEDGVGGSFNLIRESSIDGRLILSDSPKPATIKSVSLWYRSKTKAGVRSKHVSNHLGLGKPEASPNMRLTVPCFSMR